MYVKKFSKAQYAAWVRNAASVDALQRITDGASIDLDRNDYDEILNLARPVRRALLEAGKVY